MPNPFLIAAAGLKLYEGYAANQEAKSQAKWARVNALRLEAGVLAEVEGVIGEQAASLANSGFARGGNALARSERTKASQDILTIRAQGRISAEAHLRRGQNALLGGMFDAGTALATGGGFTGATPSQMSLTP